MAHPLASLVIEAWNDLDRATAGLSSEDASRRTGSASPFSWTVAHCTHMVDSWLNVRFQSRTPHPLLDGDVLRKGSGGEALDWEAVRSAVCDVRDAARPWLASLREDEAGRRIAYTGSIEALRATGISPRYALMRIAAHHYFHIGEIVTARSALGHEVGDYPGVLTECL